jgi:hypothetical protein
MLEGIHPAEASRNPVKQRLCRFFERLDRHFGCDGRELIEEFSQGMPALKVVHQVLERNSRATKTGCSVHDLGVHDNHALDRHRPLLYPSAPEAGAPISDLEMASHERYDSGMTRSKIAISLPKDQLVRVHRAVRAGHADSVSGYIAQVLADHERRESLRALLRDLIDQYGKPAAEDVKWAERALAPRRG